jgi:polysaccharide export outer membrane protein
MKYIPYFIVLLTLSLFAQDNLQVGSTLGQYRQTQGAFFDYSDPESVNIKVSVWGFVKYPGKYVIPHYSNAYDLLSYAGGPTEDANLEDIRIFRVDKDSAQKFIQLDYKDFLWGEELTSNKEGPKIFSGDILLVPGEERLYFRDYFSLTLSVISVLISLSILIINIVK